MLRTASSYLGEPGWGAYLVCQKLDMFDYVLGWWTTVCCGMREFEIRGRFDLTETGASTSLLVHCVIERRRYGKVLDILCRSHTDTASLYV